MIIPGVKAIAKLADEQCQGKSYLIVIVDPETNINNILHNFDSPSSLLMKLDEVAGDLVKAVNEGNTDHLRDISELTEGK